MAVLNEVKLPGFLADLEEVALKTVAVKMWDWFDEHYDDELLSLTVLKFFKVHIKVKNLVGLFNTLFGER